MSLEKEPAGAFNKAQRLIECRQYTRLSVFCKEGSRFVFNVAFPMPAGAVPDGLPACAAAFID
jgi:hypothetical protein